MTQITYQEIEDFHKCSTYYEKKYIDKEKPMRDRTQAGFDGHSNIVIEAGDAIRELTDYYFHRLMDNHQPRTRTVVKRWGKIWLSNMDAYSICLDPVPISRLSKIRVNTAVVSNLSRFCSTYKKPFLPAFVRETMLLPYENLTIEATLDMAHRTESNLLRIIKFTPYKISPGKPHQDLDLLIQAAAWMHNSGEEEVEVAYYNMLAPQDYNPLSIGSVGKGINVHLAKLAEGFVDKISTGSTDSCKGCIYRCKEVLDEDCI
jgi:hypothetical protein